MDLFYTALGFFKFTSIIVTLSTLGLFIWLEAVLKRHNLILFPISDPVWQLLVGLIVGDFLAYWVHRLFHAVPALWEAHRVHHSATQFNVLMTHRFHPIERAFEHAAPLLSFLLIGASPEVFLAFIVVYDILGQMQHIRLKWDYGILGKILVSPSAHLLHHSVKPVDYGKNYGARLLVWDKLFGTYSDKKITFDMTGVENDDYVKNNLLYSLVYPYKVLLLWVRGKRWKELESRA